MNLPRFIRATPAGKLMKVRTIGSSRLKNAVWELDLVRPDEHVAAVALEERPTAVGADGVGDERADRVADGREDDDEPEVPGLAGQRLDGVRVRHEEAGEREDQLGRERDHRRLDGHRDHHPDVADGAVQALEERDGDLVDELEHARTSGGTRDAAEDSRLSSGP
jgi:hypothetical protein